MFLCVYVSALSRPNRLTSDLDFWYENCENTSSCVGTNSAWMNQKRTLGQKDCTIWEMREVLDRSGFFNIKCNRCLRALENKLDWLPKLKGRTISWTMKLCMLSIYHLPQTDNMSQWWAIIHVHNSTLDLESPSLKLENLGSFQVTFSPRGDRGDDQRSQPFKLKGLQTSKFGTKLDFYTLDSNIPWSRPNSLIGYGWSLSSQLSLLKVLLDVSKHLTTEGQHLKPVWVEGSYLDIVIDREAREIIRLVASVRVSVCLRSNFWTVWPTTLIFGMRVDLDLG